MHQNQVVSRRMAGCEKPKHRTEDENMPSIDYASATKVTTQLEEQLIQSLGGDTSISRRTVLGGLGIAGGAALGLGGTQATAAPGHEDEGEHGNFGAVNEYKDTGFTHWYGNARYLSNCCGGLVIARLRAWRAGTDDTRGVSNDDCRSKCCDCIIYCDNRVFESECPHNRSRVFVHRRRWVWSDCSCVEITTMG